MIMTLVYDHIIVLLFILLLLFNLEVLVLLILAIKLNLYQLVPTLDKHMIYHIKFQLVSLVLLELSDLMVISEGGTLVLS